MTNEIQADKIDLLLAGCLYYSMNFLKVLLISVLAVYGVAAFGLAGYSLIFYLGL